MCMSRMHKFVATVSDFLIIKMSTISLGVFLYTGMFSCTLFEVLFTWLHFKKPECKDVWLCGYG
jgi:hypothetical protein